MSVESEVVGQIRVSISHGKYVVIENSVDEYDNIYIDISDWNGVKVAIDKLITEVKANEKVNPDVSR